jgi:hypothetical protein
VLSCLLLYAGFAATLTQSQNAKECNVTTTLTQSQHSGLTSTVAPIIRVLDKMYAGQMVMKQYCDSFGLDWSKWHPDVFESVQRRHENLVAEVRQVLTLEVPEGAFFPLGIKSQILLTGEAVAVDAEAQALVQEAAIAKAEARFAEKQRLREMELAGEGAVYHSIVVLLYCYIVVLRLLAMLWVAGC